MNALLVTLTVILVITPLFVPKILFALCRVVQSLLLCRYFRCESETVRVIVGKFVRGESQYRWVEVGGSNHSGILLNAVLLHIVSYTKQKTYNDYHLKQIEKLNEDKNKNLFLWKSFDWQGKPSVLFLFDPLKSDSNLVIGPMSFEHLGIYYTCVEQRAFYERRRLDRYIVARLPAGGSWMSITDGIEITYQRRRIDDVNNLDEVEHVLYLRTKGQNGVYKLEKFVTMCLRDYIDRIPVATGRAERFYFEMRSNYYDVGRNGCDNSFNNQNNHFHKKELYFKKILLATTKTFETLFFPQKKDVLMLLDSFMQKKKRFAVEGFPNKIGFVLYGPKGTGKTSFVAALAAYTCRHVISIQLSLLSTNQQLHDVFFNRQIKCTGDGEFFHFNFDEVIFLFDDVDQNHPLLRSRVKILPKKEEEIREKITKNTFSVHVHPLANMTNSNYSDKLGLSSFLNVLDGVFDTPSRIAVMTTQNIDNIDPALLRPGRFGLKLHMTNMRLPELLELVGMHFGKEDICNKGNCSYQTENEADFKETGMRQVRKLCNKDVEKVRSCVSLISHDKFEINGAVAEAMCLAAPSLDAFLDELQRRYHSDT